MFTFESKLLLAPGLIPTGAYLFPSQLCLHIEKQIIVLDIVAKLTAGNNAIGSKVSVFPKKLSFLVSSQFVTTGWIRKGLFNE